MNDANVAILGIGNLLWADEGFGIRAVEALNRSHAFADNVRLIDGGTQGVYLVQHVRWADVLVVFDAIDYGLAPGTLRLIEDDDVPSFLGAKKMSLHQTGFQEVLAMAALLGDTPGHILLVGVQPQELEDYGGSLRPAVHAKIQPAIDAALHWLADKGTAAARRDTPLPPELGLHAPQLDLETYQALRPSADQACRRGDERVLRKLGAVFDPKPRDLGGHRLSVSVDNRRKD